MSRETLADNDFFQALISCLCLFLSLSDRQGRSQNGSLIGHVTSPAQEMVVGPKENKFFRENYEDVFSE